MNIAQVSEKFDITKETLRYWERSGLLPEIPRNESGYRDYGEYELNWVFFIQVMRKAGVSIETLVEFVELYRLKTDTRAAQKQLLVEQRDKLEQQKREIEKTLNYLNYKLDNFESHVLNYEIEKLHYKIDEKDQ
ncbi:MAG: MerR family transcriptional regulator [Ligilactobacillus animalis]|uniref:MerR family transcriptional regulator n=1 Tax=Ligilactobacillus animalis TaxID=1605 RepID=UPI00242AAC2F|nr:MerR family transcriptional regulator [Ligilactobacillus animalis]MCI5942775.1 MerR family transcriptional regulator [Ligilactobacillus animalis]MDY2993211.1 MerR family transcriptional regulator [Ligilactobacillus animalis]